MKAENGTIMMAGEKIELVIDSVCVLACKREVAASLPHITKRLRKALSRTDVARHFIRYVKIGDKVLLVDRQSGFIIRLQMGKHTVKVVGIYEKMPLQAAQHAFMLMNNANLLWAVAGRKAAASRLHPGLHPAKPVRKHQH